MQTISNDKTVRSDSVQGLKKFNSESLKTQGKKAKQLFSMMLAIKNLFATKTK